MAKIPLYLQERLASSRVGVADSGNIAGGLASITARGADALADAGISAQRNSIANRSALMNIAAGALANVGEELRIRQAQKALIDKQSIELNNRAMFSNASVDLGTSLSQLSKQMEVDYKDNPGAAADKFKDQARQDIQRFIKSGAYPDEVAAKLLEYGNTHVISEHAKLSEYGISQTRKNNFQSTKSGLENDIAAMSQDGSPRALGDGLKNIAARAPAALLELGGADGDRLIKDARINGFFGWAKAAINQDYQQANDVLFGYGGGKGLIETMNQSDQFGPTPLDAGQIEDLRNRIKQRESAAKAEMRDMVASASADYRLEIGDAMENVNQFNPKSTGITEALAKTQDIRARIDLDLQAAKAAKGGEDEDVRSDRLNKLESLKEKTNSQIQRLLQMQEAVKNRTEADVKQAKSEADKAAREARDKALHSPEADAAMIAVNKNMQEIEFSARGKNARVSPQLVDKTLDMLQDAHSKGFVSDASYRVMSGRLEFLQTGKINPKNNSIRALLENALNVDLSQLNPFAPNTNETAKKAVFDEKLHTKMDAYQKKFGQAAGPKALAVLRQQAEIEAAEELAGKQK